MADNPEGKKDENEPPAGADPITRQLRDAYQSVANEPLPDELSSLLERLKGGNG